MSARVFPRIGSDTESSINISFHRWKTRGQRGEGALAGHAMSWWQELTKSHVSRLPTQCSFLPPGAYPHPLPPQPSRQRRVTLHSSPVRSLPHNVITEPGQAPDPGVHPSPVSSRHAQLFLASCLAQGWLVARLGFAAGPQLWSPYPGEWGTGHCGATSLQRAVLKGVCLCVVGGGGCWIGTEQLDRNTLPNEQSGEWGSNPPFLKDMAWDGRRGALGPRPDSVPLLYSW